MIKQDIKVTVDAMVFDRSNGNTRILLIQRKNDPDKGHWAFPGGFVEDDEDLEAAALRELEEETGMKLKQLKQFCTVGTPGRDTRFRTVSIVYYTITEAALHQVKGDDDAADAQWFTITHLPPMAFDHHDILQQAIAQLKLS